MGRIATKRADSTPENPKFDVVVWGTVSKDAELTFTKQQEIPKVSFGVSYDKKTYMNCITLKDTPTARVAADLRKGDTVLCMGVWSSRKYRGRDGNEKTWAELLCEVVSLMFFMSRTMKMQELPQKVGQVEMPATLMSMRSRTTS